MSGNDLDGKAGIMGEILFLLTLCTQFKTTKSLVVTWRAPAAEGVILVNEEANLKSSVTSLQRGNETLKVFISNP